MTRIEYDLLRDNEPELKLPAFAEFLTFRDPDTKSFVSIPTEGVTADALRDARLKVLVTAAMTGEKDPAIWYPTGPTQGWTFPRHIVKPVFD